MQRDLADQCSRDASAGARVHNCNSTMSNWWCLRNTEFTTWDTSQCEPVEHNTDSQLPYISKVRPTSSIQEINKNLIETWSSRTHALMETPRSQKPTNFTAKKNIGDIYDTHPQIMSWDNASALQDVTKNQNQIPSISSSSKPFEIHQVAQTWPRSQKFVPSMSHTFEGPQVYIVPESKTTEGLPVTNNIKPAFPTPVYVEDWPIPGGDLISKGHNVRESRQKVPLHVTSNLMTEMQTWLSELSQTYSTNNYEPIEDFLNTPNHCISSHLSIQDLTPDRSGATNIPTQTSSAQNGGPDHENSSGFINNDWSEIVTTEKCHSASLLTDTNLKQINALEYEFMQPPPQPLAIPYEQTIQSNFDRENPRESRNKAEKERRDKLNQSIAELSYLVPQVANANRKLDKTSILRLSAHYLRSYNYVFRDVNPVPNSEFKASSVEAALGVLKGFLLTTTYKGIVVVVSNNVYEYLGYNEVDLLGYNIVNVIHEDDRHIMIEQLTPNPEVLGPNGELIISDEPGGEKKVADQLSQDKRKFIVRFKKFGQRSNSGQYISCYVEGSFRKSDKARGFLQRPMRRVRAKATNPCTSGNDIVFIGIVRPIANNMHAEKKIESFHMEYITYHSIDGEITECDQRISLATGYMTQEVTGINAMNFIHKDDIRPVIIALQEMYRNQNMISESYYRLMIKNGDFIYMKSRGYLQVDGSSDVVNALICQNTILEEEEGEQMMKIMKKKYCVNVNQKEEHQNGKMENPKSPVAVVDPKDLLSAVFRMIQNLPLSPKDNTQSYASATYDCPSLRLTYIQPKTERVVSAIQKMYNFIKTFRHEIHQAQDTLNNQRSLTFMTKENRLLEMEHKNTNFNLRLTDVNGHKLTDNNMTKHFFNSGNDSHVKTYEENQLYRNLSNSTSEDEECTECYETSARNKQPLCFDPPQNKHKTTIGAYYNTTADIDTLQKNTKIGVKRSNEHTDMVKCKKKVINYEDLEQRRISLLVQDKTDNNYYFSDEDLQKHIEQAINALGQGTSPSLADLVDLDELLKDFEK